MPVDSIERYRELESNLKDPDKVAKAGPSNVSKAKAAMASFRSQNPGIFDPAGFSRPEYTDVSEVEEAAPEPLTQARPVGEEPGGIKSFDELRSTHGMEGFTLNSQSDMANVIRNAMSYEELEARRQQLDWSKELVRDKSIKTASKLKVFDTPPEYSPTRMPGLPGALDSAMNTLNPTPWFEPTLKEFREVALSHGTIESRIRDEFPDIASLDDKSDEELAQSEAYKIYSDAKWQQAVSEAMKSRKPLIRVAYSPKTASYSDPTKPPQLGLPGQVLTGLDALSATAGGALQGKTMGTFDLLLSSGGNTNKRRQQVAAMTGDTIENLPEDTSKDLRDELRASAERHPAAAQIGEVAGAMDPRGLPYKMFGLLGRGANAAYKSQSLPVRAIKAGAVGAVGSMLDENVRAAAILAANAMDAEKTARETLLDMARLPGVNPTTALIGGGLGAGLDLTGAGLGKYGQSLEKQLQVPLGNFQESGGKMGPLMGVDVAPRAEAIRSVAAKRGQKPQDFITTRIKEPLARQRLIEQEGATRSEGTATSVAQAKLEGVELDPQITAEQIRVEAEAAPGGTPAARASKKNLKDLADRLAAEKNITAERLDQYIEEVASAADHDRKVGPVEHWNNAGRHLRNFRDQYRFQDATEVIPDNDPTRAEGLFSQEDVTIAEPNAQLAGIRDPEGNVKPVRDYSAEKTRQSKAMDWHQQVNSRLGLPGELQAEPIVMEHPNKGLFSTDEAALAKVKPKVKLTPEQSRKFEDTIRGLPSRDRLANQTEFDRLAKRLPGNEAKRVAHELQVLRQLDDADKLSQALGTTIEGMSTSGNANLGIFQKIGMRAIPTLRSLSSGLPTKPKMQVTEETVSRFRKFLNRPFIPETRVVGLRGGQPGRLVGASTSEDPKASPEFTDEEAEFWLKVIRKVAQEQEAERLQASK